MGKDAKKKVIKSPLRYPGGKGSFLSFFEEIMTQNGLLGGEYFEPFAGGAGIALGLVSSRVASSVYLNDIDYHVYNFWDAILNCNDQFIEKVNNVDLSMNEWNIQKDIFSNPNKFSKFDIGFATFYLNRCNRSGILAGAGPIGGYGQTGKWKLDARFNKTQLIERIAQIGENRDRIHIDNLDAVEFLKKYLSGNKVENSLVYVDPPYVLAGSRLYLNLYLEKDHAMLASYLSEQSKLKWIMTYDDNLLIRELYSLCQKWVFSLGYSLQKKHSGTELLIAPWGVEVPSETNIKSKKWRIIEKIV